MSYYYFYFFLLFHNILLLFKTDVPITNVRRIGQLNTICIKAEQYFQLLDYSSSFLPSLKSFSRNLFHGNSSLISSAFNRNKHTYKNSKMSSTKQYNCFFVFFLRKKRNDISQKPSYVKMYKFTNWNNFETIRALYALVCSIL